MKKIFDCNHQILGGQKQGCRNCEGREEQMGAYIWWDRNKGGGRYLVDRNKVGGSRYWGTETKVG